MSLEILPRHFVEKPWGQAGLPAQFGGRDDKVGEIWFDREDASLPLLCKWLFTSEKLSVQVHPDDAQARARGLSSGKEECWIVTGAAEGATLGIGLTEQLSDQELREAALSGEIEQLLDWKPVQPGDWYYIPPGTIHAIGAGVQLVEIQQNADITYRLYDYGRPRELHLEDGVAVSNSAPYSGPHGRLPDEAGLHLFAIGAHFRIFVANGAADLSDLTGSSFYLAPIAGRYECEAGLLEPGMIAFGNPAALRGAGPGHRLLVAQQS
ncbi:type I phosphomannose isomerase catalytic subunit [Altererythrobacter arenosus]|uniref:type I phosphomannose isomerase catalytic subunit n=1 Tax=Altererythrobacter arenosus TaxID=3032592 RepID=UPI003D3132D9